MSELDVATKELNISRQAVIKTLIRQALDWAQGKAGDPSLKGARRPAPHGDFGQTQFMPGDGLAMIWLFLGVMAGFMGDYG